MGVTQSGRKLTAPERAGADGTEEVRLSEQDLAGFLVRAPYADLQPELLARNSDRFQKIGVVRDHESQLTVVAEGVKEKVTREVHVRAFLFDLDDLHRQGPIRRWVRERHSDLRLDLRKWP